MPFLLGLVSLGTLFIIASIIYQTFKPGSQGPAVVGATLGTVNSLGQTLYK